MHDHEWAEERERWLARMNETRPAIQAKRDALVEDIRAAFSDVSRKGGTSLAEVEALDAGASERECKRIRAQQRDKHWSEVDLRTHDPHGNGPAFLDPIGYRYHLPAYLIDHLTVGNHDIDGVEHDPWKGQDSIIFSLTSTSEWSDEKRNLLNKSQRRCVARFLALCLELEQSTHFEGKPDDVYLALINIWRDHLPIEDRSNLESIWPGHFS